MYGYIHFHKIINNLLLQTTRNHTRKIAKRDAQLFFVVYREIAFFACPTCVVFTFVANLRLHKVSPKCVAKGDKLHNIRVLLEPAHVSASGYYPPRIQRLT